MESRVACGADDRFAHSPAARQAQNGVVGKDLRGEFGKFRARLIMRGICFVFAALAEVWNFRNHKILLSLRILGGCANFGHDKG